MPRMPVEAPIETNNTTLYEAVAARIEQLIEAGTLRPGDRIPSVRRLHAQLSVSMSTVMEAYRLLEDRGRIRARPQSGYYVQAAARPLLAEPKASRPGKRPHRIQVSQLAYELNQKISSPEVIRLGAAAPGLEHLPLKAINRLMGQVLRWHPQQAHDYAMPPGRKELRAEIAKRMMDVGCSVGPDDILITTGATEAFYLCLRAITKAGDTIAVESPTYFGILETLETLQLRAREIATHPRDGIDLADLEAAFRADKIKALVLVSNFSNPLGTLMPDDKKHRLTELLTRFDAHLVEDDVYGDLPFDGHRPKAVKAFDRRDRVLYCNSFSKTISPGLRIGWCVPGIHMDDVGRLKLATTHASATPPQLAVAAFLANGSYERHLRRICRHYREQVERMHSTVAECFPAGTQVTRPAGGHVLWIELPKGTDTLDLYERASEQNISFAPGPLFSSSGKYRNCLRLNCGLPWSPQIEQAVRRLGELAGAG
jgi:DNA-binding transcriptional MocR family regulator